MKNRRVRMTVVAVGVLAVMMMFAPAPASAQVPDEFTNLQVLPQDITQERLVGLMKGATQALGVRCNHCHINNGDSFADFEFASDENERKGIAREMIKMVMAINQELLPPPMDAAAEGSRVTCYTCHRGETTPAIAAAQ